MVKENLLMLKEKYMKENGFMIKLKVREFIFILTELSMLDHGGWIYSMDKVRNNGQMDQSLQENTIKGRS